MSEPEVTATTEAPKDTAEVGLLPNIGTPADAVMGIIRRVSSSRVPGHTATAVSVPAADAAVASSEEAVGCAVEKRDLQDALKVLAGVGKDVLNPSERRVLLQVEGKSLIIQAHDSFMAVRMSVPLSSSFFHMDPPKPGVFEMSIPDLLCAAELSNDDLVRLSVNGASSCSVKTGTYEWQFPTAKNSPVDGLFKAAPAADCPSVAFKANALLKALKVCRPCIPDAKSTVKARGIHLGANAVVSGDGRCIAVVKQGFSGVSFNIPEKAVPALMALLGNSGNRRVQLSLDDASHARLTTDSGLMVINQEPEFVNMETRLKALEAATPVCCIDSGAFALGLKRAGLHGDKPTSVVLARMGDDLVFTGHSNTKKTGAGHARAVWQ
ncbi:MAG: hypothetical protein V2A77_11880, partial [Pseudomonadota bacterium]